MNNKLDKKIKYFENTVIDSFDDFEKGRLQGMQDVDGYTEGIRDYLCCSSVGNWDYSLENALDFYFSEDPEYQNMFLESQYEKEN